MYIRVFVTAGAPRDRVTRAPDGTLVIQTKAPAQGNEANRRVIELVAKELNIDTHSVRIYSGHRSRSKMIAISN